MYRKLSYTKIGNLLFISYPKISLIGLSVCVWNGVLKPMSSSEDIVKCIWT